MQSATAAAMVCADDYRCRGEADIKRREMVIVGRIQKKGVPQFEG